MARAVTCGELSGFTFLSASRNTPLSAYARPMPCPVLNTRFLSTDVIDDYAMPDTDIVKTSATLVLTLYGPMQYPVPTSYLPMRVLCQVQY
eukprot:3941084-Rhodomonas_salina.2